MTANDDASVNNKGPGHRLRGLFTIKAKESAPAPKKNVPEELIIKKSPEAAPPKKVEEQPVAPEPVVEEVTEKSLAYVDDNDGSKTGPCAPCEGCIIL